MQGFYEILDAGYSLIVIFTPEYFSVYASFIQAGKHHYKLVSPGFVEQIDFLPK